MQGFKCLNFQHNTVWTAFFFNFADVILLSAFLALYMLSLCLPVANADNLCKQYGPDQDRRFVGPDQGPNCLTF